MNSLSSGAVDHLVPVAEIFILLIGGLVAILIGGWKGFTWLRDGWREDLKKTLNEWADAHESRHQAHEEAINDVRKAMNAGLKRAHERIDVVMERLPPP